jgi:hypothetical protein
MRKLLFLVIGVCSTLSITAQNIREDLKRDLFKAGSNYYAYHEPTEPLTPAPKGRKPFYISTYARHGSRFLIKEREYDWPYQQIKKAAQAGKLSEIGKEVYDHLEALREEARGRYGDLTVLGATQHRRIAQRMYNNFPEIFTDNAVVDAKSTVVIRCIISMENELIQLSRNNPKLNIRSDASEHDMYYMNLQDSALYKKRFSKETVDLYKAFCDRHAIHEQAMSRLFNDSVYCRDSIDTYELNKTIFKIASSVQGTEMRYHFNLFDIYTSDELYANWLQYNAYWYLCFGNNPYNGGTQPFTQRNLLRRIIEEADNAITSPRNSASLRFGHETIVLPLTCLLDLNGFGRQFRDLEELDVSGWLNFDVFPMAANIQFVFYRKNAKDTDILFKVLLNEREATLPIQTDCAPYYHWNDFREFYLNKLNSYRE